MESSEQVSKPVKWADHDESSEEGSLREEEIDLPAVQPVASVSASTGPQDSRRAPPPPPPSFRAAPPASAGGKVVMVANLEYHCTEDDLGRFFELEGGCRVRNVRLQRDEEGKSRGMAFLEMDDEESAQIALEAHGLNFMGRRLRVEMSHSKEFRREGRDNRGGGRDRRDRPPERDNISWDRKERPPTLPPRPLRQGRPERPEIVSKPEIPAVRPKLAIQPRTKPIDAEESLPKQESIFGTGKPRDETKLKVCTLMSVLDNPHLHPPRIQIYLQLYRRKSQHRLKRAGRLRRMLKYLNLLP